MAVGEKIQFYRKKYGLSQEDLGKKLLVSRQTVSLWETGETQPTVDNLILLREIFSVSVDELLCMDTKKSEALSAGDEAFRERKEVSPKGFFSRRPVVLLIVLTVLVAALSFVGGALLFGGGGEEEPDVLVAIDGSEGLGSYLHSSPPSVKFSLNKEGRYYIYTNGLLVSEICDQEENKVHQELTSGIFHYRGASYRHRYEIFIAGYDVYTATVDVYDASASFLIVEK